MCARWWSSSLFICLSMPHIVRFFFLYSPCWIMTIEWSINENARERKRRPKQNRNKIHTHTKFSSDTELHNSMFCSTGKLHNKTAEKCKCVDDWDKDQAIAQIDESSIELSCVKQCFIKLNQINQLISNESQTLNSSMGFVSAKLRCLSLGLYVSLLEQKS